MAYLGSWSSGSWSETRKEEELIRRCFIYGQGVSHPQAVAYSRNCQLFLLTNLEVCLGSGRQLSPGSQQARLGSGSPRLTAQWGPSRGPPFSFLSFSSAPLHTTPHPWPWSFSLFISSPGGPTKISYMTAKVSQSQCPKCD